LESLGLPPKPIVDLLANVVLGKAVALGYPVLQAITLRVNGI
jgi:hypothetical protein